MKLTSQILIVLVLILGIVFTLQIAGTHAGFVFWADRAKVEESKVSSDLDILNDAVNAYRAARHEADMVAYGPDAQRAIALKAERSILEHYAEEAEQAYLQADQAYRSLESSLSGITESVPKKYTDLISNLETQISGRVEAKKTLQSEVAQMLHDITSARAQYAVDYEKFLLLEYNQYLLQEDLEHMKETLYRYRWLRPDLQAEVGDTGRMLTGNIIAATPLSVIIDKGRRDDVELYQKFTVQRDGRVIAIIDIVEVRNDESEGEIRHFLTQDRRPQPGDIVVPQTFISGLSAALPSR